MQHPQISRVFDDAPERYFVCLKCDSGQYLTGTEEFEEGRVYFTPHDEVCKYCGGEIAEADPLKMAQEISDKMDTMLATLKGGV